METSVESVEDTLRRDVIGAFLLGGPESAWVTGEPLTVDGSTSLRRSRTSPLSGAADHRPRSRQSP
ncbi:MAG TPA: hypothetical protein VHW47_01015 [Acidimicrobiales bacterium]|nr:hypothetical protein [Acidimicrobiales bacterium]